MSAAVSTSCPCCGGAVPADDLLVDESRNTIARGDVTFKMTPKQFRLFDALRRRRPAVVTRDTLLDAMMDPADADDVPTAKTLDVYVCHIRHDLARLGIEVETFWGIGYGLRIGPVPAEEERAAIKPMQRRRAAWTASDADTVVQLRRRGYSPAEIALQTNLRMSAITLILEGVRGRSAVAA